MIEAKPKTYRYEISPTIDTWEKGRQYCRVRGGDLAYHGLDTFEKRRDIIYGTLRWNVT